MANRLPSPEAYIGAVPAVAIVPWFLAGTLYPIPALPHWLVYIARVLPLTHALALLRYRLTSDGASALHNIWGVRSPAEMTALSLAVKLVRVTAGQADVSDGPAPGGGQAPSAYFLIDCPGLDTELDWAARIPAARYGTVEVRPPR